MVIVILKGGLGNQMFQYAFGQYISYLLKVPLFLDKSTYLSGSTNRLFDLDIYRIPSNVKIVAINELKEDYYSNYKSIKEQQFNYDPFIAMKLQRFVKELNNNKFLVLIEGYFQSEKYFYSIRETIKKNFKFSIVLNSQLIHLLTKITSTESVMINVRRGDYLEKLDYHGVIDEMYIKKSMAYLNNKLKEPTYFIFSDDLQWCRTHIQKANNVIFVDESYYGYKYSSYLKLMSNCKHFIISNSTFCWWAAWLADNPSKKIIAPKKWFSTDELNADDLIPDTWIKI